MSFSLGVFHVDRLCRDSLNGVHGPVEPLGSLNGFNLSEAQSPIKK